MNELVKDMFRGTLIAAYTVLMLTFGVLVACKLLAGVPTFWPTFAVVVLWMAILASVSWGSQFIHWLIANNRQGG